MAKRTLDHDDSCGLKPTGSVTLDGAVFYVVTDGGEIMTSHDDGATWELNHAPKDPG